MTFSTRWREHIRLAILLTAAEGSRIEDVRLCILRFLDAIPGRSANSSLIQDGLTDFDHDITRDQIATELAWMGEQHLLLVQPGPVIGGMLTQRGRDVAAGRIAVPGVAALPTLEKVQQRLLGVSLTVSLSDLAEACDWLRERGLLSSFDKAVVIDTKRGRDVALGRERVEGVKEASTETVMRVAANAAAALLGG